MKQTNGLTFLIFIPHTIITYISPKTYAEISNKVCTAPAFLVADTILWGMLGRTALCSSGMWY